ncbi:MAG: TonB-dependent receptor, partial [bacterium]|nr:TonB-dependent receptor [bacterium]
FRGQRGDLGWYLVENFATRGSTGANLTHLYIQDQWRVHPRLTLNLGLRTEKEVIPSFARHIQDTAFKFGFADKIAPRLGASFDVLGTGKLKVFGGWGRYYDWTKYEIARGTFGGEIWQIYYRSLDNLDAFVDPSDSTTWQLDLHNLPGDNLWDGDFRDLRTPGFDLLDPDVKPMSSDTLNFGVEYEVRPQTVFSARYVRNHL